MDEVVLNIKQWGNNLRVRLPPTNARAARLRVHQLVRLSVQGGRIPITPLDDAPLTLAQRLALFDPERQCGKSMRTGSTLGAERW
jgi:antitoxin MazE